MKTALFIALGIFTLGFIVIWVQEVLRDKKGQPRVPSMLGIVTGFVTNFFDALGVGSFATTSAIFKLFGMVRDEQIPGTLNVGHTLPSILQAFIFILVVQVDVTTLILMIAASVVGAWLGAGVVSGWSRRTIQLGMGTVLFAAGLIMAAKQLDWLPGYGVALELTGWKLVVGVLCNAVLGALMTLGIGLYAPCMILVAMLGMNSLAAFPIMMGSCAFLMPVGSARFIRTGRFDLKAALGLALGGIPGVCLAVYVVKSLPLGAVRWLVVVVVIYTATVMLRSAMVERTRLAAAKA